MRGAKERLENRERDIPAGTSYRYLRETIYDPFVVHKNQLSLNADSIAMGETGEKERQTFCAV